MRVVSWNIQFGTANTLTWAECGLDGECTAPGAPGARGARGARLGGARESESQSDGQPPPDVRIGGSRAAELALADCVRVLGNTGADVLAFQEVDRRQCRSGWVDQPGVIARTLQPLGYRWWHFAPAYNGSASLAHLPTHPAWSQWAPGFGVMLVAKERPRRWKVADLGRGPWQWVKRESGLAGRVFGGYPRMGQKRVLLSADFGEVAVGVTHLELDMDTASAQLRRAWDLTRSLAPTAVLTGDFNMRQEQVCAQLDAGSEYAGGVCTFPATDPAICIDHLIHTPAAGGSAQARSQQLPVSDHTALIVDLPALQPPAVID